ncbi:protein C19orf12 homolog isoform X3 [Syngnathoides biaculeatus]|uniref:protein C19orf12 homolog isoform X3 n=1 Tax=Syngnathoides biaculeatus TaxID=300417 RepID=UPI002ADD3B20|nr:protein C19orf12 homolog isoform X3 [Syngnathoides biaculeatus]
MSGSRSQESNDADKLWNSDNASTVSRNPNNRRVSQSPFHVSKMAPRVDDIMRLCRDISAHEHIRVAVKSSAKGAMMAGGSAFVGGLLGGPAGVAVGGVMGSMLAGWLSSGQFRPLPQILAELPPAQQRKLYEDVSAVLRGLDWTDAAQLVALVMGNATLQQQVVAALLNYVTKELRAEVRYRD